jgi:hypothetical protein
MSVNKMSLKPKQSIPQLATCKVKWAYKPSLNETKFAHRMEDLFE